MKILFLINNLGKGGSERVITELAREISKKRSVKIVTLVKCVEYEPQVEVISLTEDLPQKTMHLKIPVYVRKFSEVLKAEKPDVVISFLELSNLVNILATKKTSAKCIISVRATASEVYQSGAYNFVIKKAISKFYPRSDLIITNSKITMLDLVKNFNVPEKKIKVSYNPINLKFIEERSLEELPAQYKSLYSDADVICNVGRLTEQKGHFNLIKIFAEVKKKHAKARLVIIGEGHLKEKLDLLVKDKHLEDDVFLIGKQDNPFVFLKKSKLFVFPSFYEGFPNALVEAMACGVPVIATDCKSGPREILSPESSLVAHLRQVEHAKFGVLTPVIPRGFHKDLLPEEKMMADAIDRLLKDKDALRGYSLKGKQRVKDFEAKNIAEEFNKIIDACLKQ